MNRMARGRKSIFITIVALIIAAHVCVCLHSILRYHSKPLSSKARFFGDFYNWVSFIKTTTPENSIIILPPQTPPFTQIGHAGYCDYFLFPRVMAHENDLSYRKTLAPCAGPVFRVITEGFEYDGARVDNYVLDDDFALALLKRGEGPPRPHVIDYSDIKTDFWSASFAILKFILLILSGAWLVKRYFDERSVLGFLTTSFLVGSTVSTVLYIFFSTLNINFTEPLQFIALGLISFPGLLCLARYRPIAGNHEKSGVLSTLAGIIVCLIFIAILIKSASSIVFEWDTLATWGTKAKAILAFHNLKWLKIWGTWPLYPPLWPVILSQVAVGGETAVKLLFPIPAICLYAILFTEIQNTHYNRTLKLMLPMLLLLTPLFFEHSLSGYSNLLLTVFVTKASFMLQKLTEEPTHNRQAAFAIILCGAILTRFEGVFWVFCLASPAIFYTSCPNRILRNSAYLLIPLGCGLLWATYAATHGLKNTFWLSRLSKILDPAYLKDISINTLRYSLSIKTWALINFSFFTLVLFKGRTIIKKYLPVSVFLIMAFFGIFILSCALSASKGVGIAFHFKLGFARYIMPVVPIAFALLLKELDSGNTANSNSS